MSLKWDEEDVGVWVAYPDTYILAEVYQPNGYDDYVFWWIVDLERDQTIASGENERSIEDAKAVVEAFYP